MHFFNSGENTSDNGNIVDPTDDLTQRMRNAARMCMESCSVFASTEMGQKLIAYTIVGGVVVGAGLIFGTAFKTANTVKLTNNSNNILYPKWIQPFGVKDKWLL